MAYTKVVLFCIGLNHLSHITKSRYGYKFCGVTISHLLCMADIKLYAKHEQYFDSLIHHTRIYSNDIGMSFGLEKNGCMVAKEGNMIRTEGVELP